MKVPSRAVSVGTQLSGLVSGGSYKEKKCFEMVKAA